jgi:hypothetical protein
MNRKLVIDVRSPKAYSILKTSAADGEGMYTFVKGVVGKKGSIRGRGDGELKAEVGRRRSARRTRYDCLLSLSDEEGSLGQADGMNLAAGTR